MPFGSGQGDPYNPAPFRFNCRGLQVAKPVDFLELGEYPFFQNFRISLEGQMRSRGGLAVLDTGHPGIHSIFRLTDLANNDYNYFVGVDTSLKFGKGSLALIESIYSGMPMTGFDARPERSPSPRLYLTDGSVMRKLKVDGTAQQWGIFPPNDAPSVTMSPPEMTSITDCTSANPEGVAENGNVWGRQNNATIAMTQTNRTNTTIASILYDSGTTGYCNIEPTAMGTDIQPGQRILVNGGGGTAEYVAVEQTFPAIKSTTIESIIYHSGAAGLCTIQLATPTTGLVANTLVRINSAETVRVLSVTNGPDGKPCFRCVTAGTFTAGQAVTGFRNFRAFAANNHAAAETLVTKAYESQIDPDAGTPNGLGSMSHNISLDLSSAGGRPITDNDEITIGIYLADITRLIEGRVFIDLDPGTGAGYAATDFTRNALVYPFRVADLQRYTAPADPTTQINASRQIIQFNQIDEFNQRPIATVRDPLTGDVATFDDLVRRRNLLAQGTPENTLFVRRAKQALLRRYDEALGQAGEGGGILTAPVRETPEFQAGSGSEQWYQLRFKVGDMQRVGTDQSRTLKDSTSFRIQFNLSGTTATVVRFSSVWIGGTYGPDAETDSDLLGNAYYYRYTGRNSETGESGLPSPPTRAGVVGRRQKRTVAPVQHPDAQVDKLDIYRYGGTLLQWVYIGTVANSMTPTFVDTLSDESIAGNPLLSFENFPPVPTADLPRTGNCNVVGTRFTRTGGDMLNTNYSPGVEVVINGKTFLAYARPEDNDTWELTESAGTVTGGVFEIPNPIIMGMPLPTVFGPYGQGSGGLYYFLIGDPINPGVMYWTIGNDPNSVSDLNSLEITGPSEPLVTGCIYDGRPYVGSSERLFVISENPNPQPGENRFRADEVANSKGAWARLGMCVDTLIYYIGKDGVYESEGGQPRSITDDSLYPLFSHEGFIGGGMDIIGATGLRLPAPDYRRPESMRLVGDGQFIYFIFQENFASYHMFIWEKRARRWLYDVYGDGGLQTIFVDRNVQQFLSPFDLPNYLLGGTVNGAFVVVGSGGVDVDVSNPINAKLLTLAHDFGDSRANKRLGDVMLDAATGADTATTNLYSDNFETLIYTAGFQSNNRVVSIIDVNNGDEIEGINIGLLVSMLCTQAGELELFEWQPTAIYKPPATFLRATDWDLAGGMGAKFLQGLLIEADTNGQDREIQIQSADGGFIESIIVNHARQSVEAYSLTNPQIGSSFRLRPVDVEDWNLYNIQWIHEPAPEQAKNWRTQGTNNDICGWWVNREAYVTLISTDSVTFTIDIDGVPDVYTIPSTAGLHKKVYFPLRAKKGMISEYAADSPTPFRLFKKDTCIMIAPWGRTDSMIVIKPFGGQSRADGAAI